MLEEAYDNLNDRSIAFLDSLIEADDDSVETESERIDVYKEKLFISHSCANEKIESIVRARKDDDSIYSSCSLKEDCKTTKVIPP